MPFRIILCFSRPCKAVVIHSSSSTSLIPFIVKQVFGEIFSLSNFIRMAPPWQVLHRVNYATPVKWLLLLFPPINDQVSKLSVTLSRYFLMSFLKSEIVVVIIFAKFSTILSTTSQKQVYRLSYSKYSILSLSKEYVIYLVVNFVYFIFNNILDHFIIHLFSSLSFVWFIKFLLTCGIGLYF